MKEVQVNLSKPSAGSHDQEQVTKFDRAKRIARRFILYFIDWVIE